MALLSISGRIGSGKDTVGKIIQYLIWKDRVESGRISFQNYNLKDFYKLDFGYQMSGWKQVAFADKLKDIVCLLIGCTREQLEEREFKEKELGEEWWKYELSWHEHAKVEGVYNTYEEACEELRNFGGSSFDEKDAITTIKLTPRLLMQLIGTECGRNIIHPNIWVNSLFTDYTYSGGFEYAITETPYGAIKSISAPKAVKGEYPNWIITDLRFPNEYEAVKQRGGITIRVNRYNSTCVCVDDSSLDCLTPCSRKPQHESEVALDHVTDWDYVIDNSGTIEELVEKVRTILVNEKII